MSNNQDGTTSLDSELHFEKLTATRLSDDEMQDYTKYIDFVFQENDLLNIAITGPYASGKSSVIKTYEEDHKKYNGIHISLAYFSPTLESKIKGKKKDDELAFEDELMLERKIINQLIHQIDPNKIPATEFKVKNELKKRTKLTWTIIITLLIFLFIYGKEITLWFSVFFNGYHVFESLLLLFICFVTYNVLILQDRKNLIRTLKIFENEIDISTSNCDVSYFDRYLNEITYILDKSNLDFIVFEDIDRYDDNLILNKLRELNYIYNKKQAKNKPKPIRFFYLIKDELFESKERTKFFDFSFPVVPFMDNSNSLEKMENIFVNHNIRKDFSTSFLFTLSLYLDDIRLIKNICNEYIIYKNKLEYDASWFKNENLLAVIVYKNIFPADFSLTRIGLGQGVVHRIIISLINQKKEFLKDEIKRINEEINSKKEEINIIEESHLKNIDELDALFIKIPYDIKLNEYRFANGNYNLLLNRKDFIQALKNNDMKMVSIYNSYNELNFEKNFEDLEENEEYQNRKKEIEVVVEKDKATLEEEISELEKEKALLEYPIKITEIIQIEQNKGVTIEALLKKHIEEEKVEKIKEIYNKEYEKLSSSCYFPLLRVLITQGYIDEYYSDYTSSYDKKELPKNDTLFLRNIAERTETDFDFKLKKPEIVLTRLKSDPSIMSTERSVLNYSLLDYILEHEEIDNLLDLIQLIKSQKQVSFVNGYFSRCYALLRNENTENADKHYKPEYLYRFIEKLNVQFPLIWQSIDFSKKRLYLYLSFIRNDETILDKMNEINDLKNFIEFSSDFLLIDDEWNTIFNLCDKQENKLTKIVNALKKLNIKLKEINNATPQLLELVEKNETYQLCYISVKYILENKYNKTNIDYCLIQAILELEGDAPIKTSFNENPEGLVSAIDDFGITTFDDNEKTALFVLNNEKISLSTKIAYINKLSTVIKQLDQITDRDIWDTLLEKEKIDYSAKNMIHYFFNYKLEDEDEDEDEDEVDSKSERREINKHLSDFINKSSKNISSEEAGLNKLITEEDERNLLFRKIIITSDLNDEKYRMLFEWFNNNDYVNFNYQNINKEKISILIQHNAIRLKEEQDLTFLRENYPDNIIEIITHNFKDYINKLDKDDSLVNYDEIIRLLSTDLSSNQKISLLNLTNKPISIKNENYSVKIKRYILENNFDVEDLDYITQENFYDRPSNEIKEIIKKLCIEYKTQVLRLNQISYKLLINLFSLKHFSLDEKYILLSNQIHYLMREKTISAFKKIEEDKNNYGLFSNLFFAKTLSFENTELNRKIINELKNIYEFTSKIEANQIIVYGK